MRAPVATGSVAGSLLGAPLVPVTRGLLWSRRGGVQMPGRGSVRQPAGQALGGEQLVDDKVDGAGEAGGLVQGGRLDA